MGNAISHGTANDENVIVQVTYDKAGRRVALRDPRGNQTTYAYDQLDRRTGLSNPLSQTWTTTYSDLSGERRRVTRTNPLGQQVEEDYDRLGRLTAVRYLNETPKHTPDVVFRYDAAGNRTAMDETLDGGVTWLRKTQYGYDGVRRLVSVGFDTNGDGVVEETVTYQYDAGGRRTQMTLPGNRTVQYAYDVKGQLVSLTDWDGQTTRYRYDNAGRLREAQGPNLLTRRWRYDAAGRLRHQRHSREGKTLGDFAYEVDKRGDRTQARECLPQAATGTTVVTHSSPAIDYLRGTWAAVGDFHETTTMGAALRTEVFGTELTLVMGAGPDHSLYDVYLNGTLRDSLDGYAATPGERSLSYSLTDEGPHTVEVRNRTDKNLVSSGYKLRFKRLETNRRYDLHTIQYAYDKLERLRAADYRPAANLSAALFRQHGYAYDVAGNRIQVNDNGAITNYTYNAANQITNPGFSYDAAGRMTSDSTNTYAWDRADRLLSVGGVQNQYNGLGQRVQQSVGAQVTQYLLDTQPGLWQVLASTTGTDTMRYVHGPTGIQQQQNPDNAWLYPTQDALGSVRSVADATMAVLESRHYEPYGEPWGVTGTETTDFGFTGEPTDDNGLVYLRARQYSPALGVFPGLDPLEGELSRAMSVNRYGWVEGNVANRIDPSGMILERPEKWSGCQSLQQAQVPCCGPDATLWLHREIGIHWTYAMQHRSMNRIELACTALKVNYGYVNYQDLELDSARRSGRSFAPSYSTCSKSPNLEKRIVSICGKCQDATDIGNFMIGMIAAMVGEGHRFATEIIGRLFNVITNDASPEADILGVEAGWWYGHLGLYNPYYDRFQFCGGLGALGQHWHEALDQSCGTSACDQGGPNLDYATHTIPGEFVSKVLPGGSGTTTSNLLQSFSNLFCS